MVNGTDKTTGLNEVAHKLGQHRQCRSTRIFSQGGRALVECRGELASELWDVGRYEFGIGSPRLTQDEDGPFCLAAYNGQLPSPFDYEAKCQITRWLNAQKREASPTPWREQCTATTSR